MQFIVRSKQLKDGGDDVSSRSTHTASVELQVCLIFNRAKAERSIASLSFFNYDKTATKKNGAAVRLRTVEILVEFFPILVFNKDLML